MKLPFLTVVENDFGAVNQLILESLSSHVPLVEEISNYLIEAGGKRLRPILVLLSAKACGYQQTQHISLAAIIEFLHTAMLLHDDVVDASDLRRGRKTVNAAWGNPASVLVGDFLHSRAFEMMVEIGDMKVMQILSHATNTIAEGEVQQLTNIRNPRITEADYLQVISRKTAMLFEAASHSGAVLAHGTLEQQTALQAYGLHLGRAFQLVDDVLDYKGTADDMGKNIGDDLAEGKATLPLIVAMRDGEPDQADFVRQAILNGGVENLDRIAQIVEAAGGLKYTSELAVRETTAAIESLAALPDSPYKTAMLNLAEFSISRNH
ncbi:MAG: polyprenyl synthetase family protein [Pseudomonadales bacterium]|jgi:octaprenyl-diphosphate synthase|tara:strand:- start:11157 stop:12122 length:966 start_codon:yes stop_codon:yes gene_type:complete